MIQWWRVASQIGPEPSRVSGSIGGMSLVGPGGKEDMECPSDGKTARVGQYGDGWHRDTRTTMQRCTPPGARGGWANREGTPAREHIH